MTNRGAEEIREMRGAPTLGAGARPIRVCLLARSNAYIDGLKSILADQERYDVVACVEPGEECHTRLRSTPTDVMLVHEPSTPRPLKAAFGRLHEARPEAGILFFGPHADVEFAAAAVRAGARGYIQEQTSTEDLCRAVEAVGNGRVWLNSAVLDHVLRDATEFEEMIEQAIRDRMEQLYDTLSERETRIFELVLEGLSTREIAETVHLSEQSVKLYLGRLFRKFDVSNRSQLLAIAFQRICPVSNLVRVFRMAMDKRRIEGGRAPLIPDPLDGKHPDTPR